MTIQLILSKIIGALLGGFIGFVYYKKVGCPNGGCPITSNPYISTIYGAVIGIMLSTTF